MENVKLKMISLMLIVIMVFAGCQKQEISLKINSDGSGKLYSCVSIDEKEMIDDMVKIYKVLGMSDEQIGTVKNMQEYSSNYFTGLGYKEVTVDGKKYYQKTVESSSTKKNLSRDAVGNDGYVTADTFYYEVNLKEMMIDSIQDQAEKIAEQRGMTDTPDAMMLLNQAGVDFGSLMTVEMTVEFPKLIVSTNGTVDSKNKNKVTFVVKASESKTFFATTNSKVTLASAQAKYKADNTIKKPKIKKLKANKVSKKAKKATITLKFSKVAGAKKYQVQYSTKSSFKGAKTKTIKKTTYKITKLKKNKKYYVRVRAVKQNIAGSDIYSSWAKKSVKTKK